MFVCRFTNDMNIPMQCCLAMEILEIVDLPKIQMSNSFANSGTFFRVSELHQPEWRTFPDSRNRAILKQ